MQLYKVTISASGFFNGAAQMYVLGDSWDEVKNCFQLLNVAAHVSVHECPFPLIQFPAESGAIYADGV